MSFKDQLRKDAPALVAICGLAGALLGSFAWSSHQAQPSRQEERRQEAMREQESARNHAVSAEVTPTTNLAAPQEAAVQVSEQNAPVKLLSWSWPTLTDDPAGDWYDPDLVIGRLKNDSSEPISFVSVEFNLYDEDGNRLGTAQAAMNGLGPGEVWKFLARVDDRRVKKVTFGQITHF